jgi:hypothetical protein
MRFRLRLARYDANALKVSSQKSQPSIEETMTSAVLLNIMTNLSYSVRL